LAFTTTDIVVIGAGPYGLSLAAHLRGRGKAVRIFGSPMNSWAHHMPQAMHLKSEGFASDLYDPEAQFTLKAYCALHNIPYADIGLPVAIETFTAYGLEFQRRFAPNLENVQITSLAQSAGGFELVTSSGETLRAPQVVVAAGIVNFAYLPPVLAASVGPTVSHSRGVGRRPRRAASRGGRRRGTDRPAPDDPVSRSAAGAAATLATVKSPPFRAGHWLAFSHVHRYSVGISRPSAIRPHQGS
jgi:hypothetical protein